MLEIALGIKSQDLICCHAIIFTMVLSTSNSAAQIFKCELAKGKIVYQDKACKTLLRQHKLKIKKFDQAKIERAQEKLKLELQQYKQIKAMQQEKLLKEREIQAMESQARSNQELIEATRKNAEAINQNRESIRNNNQRNTLNFYYPSNKPFPFKSHRNKSIRMHMNK